ncbi:J domain-containing protein [Drosera capensis]
MGEAAVEEDDQLMKKFFAEVGEVERDNEVVRILSCFKLNPFEYLNLPFSASPEDVRKQYRKLSLLVHPDKCKHPQAKEAFGALAKAQQLLLDSQEKDYILSQVTAAQEELLMKWKKQLKKDTASKIKSLVDEKFEEQYVKSDEFQQQLKLKVRQLLTDQEWRRRKMAMRISEEEGRLKKDEEEQKEMWKKKREHEEQWEGTRENRVSSWRDFMKSGKKAKKGELRPPKLKTEDPNKSYVQRPVKRG